MNLFEAVKASVTAKQAAERYGIEINRAGKACCIFHNDRHPSMKVDERFHCFSCGADGDAIDLAARIFGISLKEAAEQLAADFQIQYDREKAGDKSARVNAVQERRSLLQRLKNYQNENYRALCGYFHLLRQWASDYAPRPEDEEWHPLYLEALQNSARVEYLLDELMDCPPDKAKEIIALNKNEIGRYANRVREVHAAQKRVRHEPSR